jgi:hypothetical protein
MAEEEKKSLAANGNSEKNEQFEIEVKPDPPTGRCSGEL